MASSMSAPCGAEITAPTAEALGSAYSAHISSCSQCVDYQKLVRAAVKRR